MAEKIILNGITWNHSRGITPLLAAAQRFSELNPEVDIVWKKRTLQEFADMPVEKLAKEYDMLIIDHPWVGCAAETRCVIPLDQSLSNDFLNDQIKNTVGGSHRSYHYKGHQWALAIDAATPAASYRADLFAKSKLKVPSTWHEVLDLARTGRVLVAGIPVDTLMTFYMFCLANGKEPFTSRTEVIDKRTGLQSLENMRELWSICDNVIFESNPIRVAEMMTTTDDFWYCPFAYCYSNYSRAGYARKVLTYSDLPFFKHERFRSTIGGTGLAISETCQHKDIALKFAQWVLSGECQSTFYVENGGQPGHQAGWLSKSANVLCNNFFINVLPAMDRGYIRPRYNGYLDFQDHAGTPIQRYLKDGGNPNDVLEEINGIYRESLLKSRE